MDALLKTLLITGTAPGEPGVGGVILKDLISIAGESSFHCCWLTPQRHQESIYMADLATTLLPRRYETGWKPVSGLLGEIISWGTTTFLTPSHIQGIANSVEQQIERFQPDQILCVLESTSVVRLISLLLSRLRLPLLTIVWDDIHTVCPHSVLDRWTRKRVYREFGSILKRSDRIAVICENMAEAYQRDYGVKSFVLRHGMDEAAADSSTNNTDTDAAIRIGFAGSITAPDCMQSLISTLDNINWQIDGQDVCLRMLGSRFQLGTRSRQWIEYLGWRDVCETRDLLSQCDILYLPQSFSPHLRHLTELSFPTKLSTYISTQIPILLQTPDYGSLHRFWKSYAMGPTVQTLNQQDLLKGIHQAITPADKQRSIWHSNRQAARESALSESVFRSGVCNLLSTTTLESCQV